MTRRCWVFCLVVLDGCLRTGALSLMGSSGEFPLRYQTSVRSLSKAILDARPADVESLRFPISLQDKSRWLLKLKVAENTDGLKREVARLEQHFRRIRGMRGSRNLQSFIPVAQTEGAAEIDLFRLTAYSDYYNLFFLESPVIGSLYWTVKAAFYQYAEEYRWDLNRTYFLHGWFNCFRGGGKISFHRHGYGLAGNIAVHVPPGSYTRYGSMHSSKEYPWLSQMQRDCQRGEREACKELAEMWKYEELMPEKSEASERPETIPNAEGELVIFHGLVEHESSNVTEEMRKHLKLTGPTDCRMTIAFDIDTDPSELHHSVPLHEPGDPWWTKNGQSSLGAAIGSSMERIFQESGLPTVFDWDEMPDGKRFTERMHRALRHEGSVTLSAWSKRQVKEGWADLHEGLCTSTKAEL